MPLGARVNTRRPIVTMLVRGRGAIGGDVEHYLPGAFDCTVTNPPGHCLRPHASAIMTVMAPPAAALSRSPATE